jgi:UDP-N-acetylmuramate dehydrogenase
MAAMARSRDNGKLRKQEPMSRHTTWRVGGPADLYYKPADLEDLCGFVAGLPADVDVIWLGLGSNLLVRDGGIRGVVIATHGALGRIDDLDDCRLRVEAGVPCAKLARYCARRGVGPAEFFAGIPGTVGGALAMNAGAFGGETWECVTAVETLNRQGQIKHRKATEYDVGYRSVIGPEGEWFVAAQMQFHTGATTGEDAIKDILARRKDTQPLGEPSCGSVFRNPPGDHAARLIESAGLKGYRIGGAHVSEKHANFIINDGNATAADVEALINHVATTVESSQGVELQMEVRIIGDAREAS